MMHSSPSDPSALEAQSAHDTAPTPPDALLARAVSARRYLSKHLTLYRQASERLSLKQRLLIEGNMNQLDAVDAELQALDAEIARVEAERVADMASRGEDPQAPLSRTLSHLPPEQARPLNTLRHELTREIETARQRNERVQALLQASIQWVSTTIDAIAKTLVPEGGAYNQRGQRPGAGHTPETASTIRREI